MNKLELVKPIGFPHAYANLIKSAKVSSDDFEETPAAAEEIKNMIKFSLLEDKEAGTSDIQDLGH